MPGQFEGILDKLQTKLGKQTIKRASTINRPRPKREVQQIQIFNEFNRRNPKADGGRVGFRGGGAYQGGRSSTGRSSTSRGPAGGASAGGNYGGNRNPKQTYGGSIFRGGGEKDGGFIDGTNRRKYDDGGRVYLYNRLK